MNAVLKTFLTSALMFFFAAAVFSQEKTKDFYSAAGNFELGFLAVASHKIQFGDPGTYIDYVEEGGQDVLFPVMRMSFDFILYDIHRISFLYQPLEIVTQSVLKRDVTVDGTTFTSGTPVEFRYSFPFYRLSYAYDFIEGPAHTLAFGLSFQIRNADITFRNLDGSQFVRNSNIGPVPILKLFWQSRFDNGCFVGSEIDGFYAPISYINGSDNEVVGAILDASLRGGFALNDWSDAFLNLRYLGGGAVGSSDDGYTKNWLHFITVTAGFTLKFI